MTEHSNHGDGGSLHVHIMPLRVLVGVFVALVILTVLTVAATEIDLGAGNLWIAMLIAGVKGLLVALYFMHLKYDRPLYGIVFLSAIFFVVLFIGIALMDTQTYQPELVPGYAPGIEQ